MIDIGGGAAPLAGLLLDAGYSVAVLDIAPAAIDRARQRLGARAEPVRWIIAMLLPALGGHARRTR